MLAALYHKPSSLHYMLLFIAAFFLRSATFYLYVQHHERYQQADSADYHVAGLCVAYGLGMKRPDGKYIFWRTPGYPAYLAPFFRMFGQPTLSFDANAPAHKAAIWSQILISSLLPLIVLLLAYVLTKSYPISIITAWISVFHVGFILATTYLLTDAIAGVLFALFLLCYFSTFRLMGESKGNITKFPWINLMSASLFLAAYTWMRPMGQFIGILAAFMLLFAQIPLQQRLLKIAFFSTIFMVAILPWFVRNYNLTGKLFFCPLFGLYLNVFNAPKILARVDNIPLKDAHQKLSQDASLVIINEMERYKTFHSPYIVCNEQLCMKTAWPLIKAHPWFFFYDWMVEVIKTTFDLYSSQIVNLVAERFKWDPLVEYLDEKIAECLYKQQLPLFARFICWLEFIVYLFIWIGIFAGLLLFLVPTIIKWSSTTSLVHSLAFLWVKAGLFIGATLMQTGGFGYARLRLPIEPLIIILAVTFWWWFFNRKATILA